MYQNNSFEKIRLKITQILVPPTEKISEYAADTKKIFKRSFYVFFGSNVFVFN